MVFNKLFLYVFLLFVSVAVSSCAFSKKTPEKPGSLAVNVTVSLAPFADFVREIGGDKVKVSVVIPPGANPHVFEPTPSQLSSLAKSDIFIFMGLDFEFWKDKFINSVGNKSLRLVELSDGMNILDDAEEEHVCEDSDCTGHSKGNPHLWTSPKAVIEFIPKIEKALCDADPGNSSFYKSRAGEFKRKLLILDKECAEMADSLKNKKFLSQHAAWTYFAHDYNLQQIGIIELSPGKEPSPAHIKQIIDLARKNGVKMIFADAQFSPKAAQVVADDGKLVVVRLDPIGDANTSYITLMRSNLAKIREASELNQK